MVVSAAGFMGLVSMLMEPLGAGVECCMLIGFVLVGLRLLVLIVSGSLFSGMVSEVLLSKESCLFRLLVLGRLLLVVLVLGSSLFATVARGAGTGGGGDFGEVTFPDAAAALVGGEVAWSSLVGDLCADTLLGLFGFGVGCLVFFGDMARGVGLLTELVIGLVRACGESRADIEMCTNSEGDCR